MAEKKNKSGFLELSFHRDIWDMSAWYRIYSWRLFVVFLKQAIILTIDRLYTFQISKNVQYIKEGTGGIMKRIMLSFTAILFFSIHIHVAFAQQMGSGKPIAFVSGCDVDLNKDGDADSALLIHSSSGYELIVIMRLKEGTKSYVLNRSSALRHLTCQYGLQIKETDAGPGKKKGKIYEIDREFITLLQPESSEVAYFWMDGEFKEVWLSD